MSYGHGAYMDRSHMALASGAFLYDMGYGAWNPIATHMTAPCELCTYELRLSRPRARSRRRRRASSPRASGRPRGRGRAAGARALRAAERARDGRAGAHRAWRGGAQAAGQTHAKDKAEIRVVLAVLRDAAPAESRAARLRCGLPPRQEPPPRAQVPPPRAAPKPRPVPRGHPGPTCSSDGAGCVAAGLARTEPRVSLVAAPRSLLGVGSPATPACRAGRVREDPGPAGWWPLAGPARVRARLAGWSPPRVAAGRPGAPLRAPRRPVAAPETKPPRPAARPRSAGGSKGRSRSPPSAGVRCLSTATAAPRVAGRGSLPICRWRSGGPRRARPCPGFLRSGPRFFGRPR